MQTYQTANATLDGQGNLKIEAAKSKGRGGYSSGWVDTKNKVSFGYGTITARIKVPQGQGLWPSFWIKGANEDTISGPNRGDRRSRTSQHDHHHLLDRTGPSRELLTPSRRRSFRRTCPICRPTTTTTGSGTFPTRSPSAWTTSRWALSLRTRWFPDRVGL